MNKFKEQDESEVTQEEEERRPNRAARVLVGFLNGNFLTRENVLAQLPFLFFLTFLLVCYIGYGYYTEKTVNELYEVKKDLKELRSEYITTKSELMFKSKRSEVVDATKPLGLKESVEPPKKIVIEEDNK